MRTPRPHAPSKGIGTLIGNGWLRESPRNRMPAGAWDLRGKSLLRKCLYMPVPKEILAALPPAALGGAARPAPAPRPVAEPVVAPERRRPERDVRMMPAVDPALVRRVVREQMAAEAPARWESPVALGLLLLLAPPVGLAMLWSSRRYSNDARWALTTMTALGMCLASAVAITALALR